MSNVGPQQVPPTIKFPAIAISRAGWHKTAREMDELTDASPTDDLAEWQGLVIVDAEGTRLVAGRVFRTWPKHRWGAALCRVLNHSVHVGFEFAFAETLSLQEVVDCVSGVEELPAQSWSCPREIMEYVCS
jgi:hypothetical protein